MPKLDITSQERSALRARAHPLRPVVLVGDRGLTESVIQEIDRNLTAHQLIKVKMAGQERDEREASLESLCEQLSCAPVHHLGKTLILFRPDAKQRRAEEESVNATRAVRKPTEPHTPKKLAAAGVTKTRKAGIAERSARKTERLENAAPKVRRASTPGTVASGARKTAAKPAAGASHGIPRRGGSALSLKAGARRSAVARPKIR
ncbi:YhbY family RNA-binding protein [Pusillimonas minor]|uniref:YhbY family RNA-binding protein n=1 Tax=Pusillimonas minor TaxID=2697024 RepID=A0A842HQ61_9BURK|nr:YhbY family RNA-binding protein [Pusillimonas minor]MBC2770413.1 YhbY family RNA-binding protein [Pusillimonas minor]